MTLSEIEASTKEFLTVNDIAECLGTNPNTIRYQARMEPDKLGFPVIVLKNRVKIPRDGFVFYCKYGATLRLAFEGVLAEIEPFPLK